MHLDIYRKTITKPRRRFSEDAELMEMGSRTSRIVPDGLPRIPKPSRIKPSASKLYNF